ncbi:MAG: dTMP kinase [Candidatus Eremiobacteraeota bacterium]|nr:dTMP kinase [Candidatus Eremiobacteraeota bacterium]
MFITFEGIEGSGKTTLMRGVARALRAKGKDVIETREPGGTAVGDRIREIFLDPKMTIAPLAEALLLTASRHRLVEEVITPALQAGSIVLCDRFTDSTLAYQGFGRGIEQSLLKQFNEAAAPALEPDLTFYVDVSLELSRMRVTKRSEEGRNSLDRLDREGDQFHERVREGYLELARANPQRIAVLDGSLPEEALVKKALDSLRAHEQLIAD